MVAAAKALADAARDSKILAIRGGVLQGRPLTVEEVETLAKLPPVDVLRGQVLGAIIAPLTALLGLVTAPLQNLHGLIDARIEQLGGAEGEEEPAQAEGSPEESTAEKRPTFSKRRQMTTSLIRSRRLLTRRSRNGCCRHDF